MKVLLVHDYGTPTGGAELQMLSLRRGLRERGVDARLFSSRASLVESEFAADYDCYGTMGKLQVISETFNVSAWWNLCRVLEDFRPDVVHVRMFLWQLSPSILPLLREYPCIYQTATYKSICPIGTKLLADGRDCSYQPGVVCMREGCVTPQTWIFRMLQRQLFLRYRHMFHAVVAQSHQMKRTLEQAGFTGVQVIHNGVPERDMRPPLPDMPIAAYAGRFTREKGIDVLLKALAEIKNRVREFRLLLAGDGPERDRLLALAARLGLKNNLIVLGHISREDMEREFERAWVQVVPSLWSEPFGNVATEAMVRGTAVIASATGGLSEIVADGKTGLLVPPGSVQALAAALEKNLCDKRLAERFGSAGHVRALSEFSESRCLDRFMALYAQLATATA